MVAPDYDTGKVRAEQMLRVAMLWVKRLATGVAAAGVMALTLIVGYEVFSRYALNRPTSWASETAAYTLVWLGLLAVMIALAEGAHLRVDLVYARFPPRVQVWLDIFTTFLMLLFALVVIWKGYLYWWQAHSKGWLHYGTLYFPMTYTRIAVPVMGVLLALQVLLKLWDHIRQYDRMLSLKKRRKS